MVALIASSIWRVMSIISFSPFELTVMIVVITDISITIENSTFILLYDELRPFDEAPVTSNKNFLMNLQLFCISLAPNVSLRSTDEMSKDWFKTADGTLGAKLTCEQKKSIRKDSWAQSLIP
jgi:hypothetical protein